MSRKRVDMLNVSIDALSEKEAFKRAVDFFEGDSLKTIYTPNPEIVMLAQTDSQLKEVLNGGDLVVPDGIGLIIASKLKGRGLVERIPGVDLMHRLLIFCGQKEKSIYLFGGKPGVADAAALTIAAKYPGVRIAGFHHGYFKPHEEEDIVKDINESGADVVFVCLGAPKQELWINQHKAQLNCKIAMGVGGSIDVYAGTVKRAPKIYQKLALEWFYRLMKEPRRYKRMLLLPKFLVQFILRG